MARLAERRGEADKAAVWRERAEALRRKVEALFWIEDRGFYGIAVDGQGQLCRVLSSNPGHLLFCGLPSPARAREVTDQLLSGCFHSGWGLRTLATGEARFNPISYHNGSVWPHDTALCVMGLSRYGERDGVVKLTSALFETASGMNMRLPELFCGFPRSAGEPPVAYPVACLPQAWAAGSVFMMLQACLGVTIDANRGEIILVDPRLPIGIDRLKVERLRVGADTVDLTFERQGDRISVHADGGVPLTIRSRPSWD